MLGKDNIMENFKIKEGVLDKLKSPCLTIDDSMKPLIEITQNHIVTKMDEYIVNAVCEMDIDVDKERLVKALTDARSFYNEGYAAAKERYERKWISRKILPEKADEYLVLCYIDGEYRPCFAYYTNGSWRSDKDETIEYWMIKPEI